MEGTQASLGLTVVGFVTAFELVVRCLVRARGWITRTGGVVPLACYPVVVALVLVAA